MKINRNSLIFIVEDNLVYNDLILGILKEKKFTNLKSFTNPEECYRNLHLHPDIIILN